MPKALTKFICQQCGMESPKWLGKCPECGEWNSFIETVIPTTKKGFSIGTSFAASPQKLSQIKPADLRRIKTNISEFDRVLGGGPPAGEAGLVPGSVVLVAGEPGIGKSTLMLELGDEIGGLYISGEESLHQIKLRAERLKIKGEKILFLSETDVDIILETIKNFKKEDFKVLIVDSIQTLTTQDLTSSAGSVGQVRECASKLLRMAKSSNIAVFLIGHVTKEGMLAGPKILEHMVDTVLSLEGEKFGAFRLLRTTKNRFGATDEVGVFEMTDKGMVGIENPSKLFLSQRQKSVPGSVIV
ncbi:DNA repair protein RadA, partial [Candidatus Woesebacteria bacterium CG_4_10_14_0_2_um_filter_39_14]